MAFTLPALPYAYDALTPYIDEETMHLHHEKHHNAYITSTPSFVLLLHLSMMKISRYLK